MSLPAGLARSLETLLGVPPSEVRPVGGGDISQAARLEADGRTLLVKWLTRLPRPEAGWPGMFEAEARGLALLASTGTVRVPAVHGFGEPVENAPAYIVMDWIGRGNEGQRSAEQLLHLTHPGRGR
ncbi:MAG TPA: fructosamine kinase family protein, partial [Anaerolineae bacterium]|nr:fructosamine kinase family protein [Anaerolineae bacterium]